MNAHPRSSHITEFTYREITSTNSPQEVATTSNLNYQRRIASGDSYFGYKPPSVRYLNLSSTPSRNDKTKKPSESSVTLPPISELVSPLSPLPGYRAHSVPNIHSNTDMPASRTIYPTFMQQQHQERSSPLLMNHVTSQQPVPTYVQHIGQEAPQTQQIQASQLHNDAPPLYVTAQYQYQYQHPLSSPSNIHPSAAYNPHIPHLHYNKQSHYIAQPGLSSAHAEPVAQEQIAKKEIKRRTRTGCLTCRKRRIKCDERKPTCNNCQKSKVHCLGYQNKPTKNELKKLQRLQLLQNSTSSTASSAFVHAGVV